MGHIQKILTGIEHPSRSLAEKITGGNRHHLRETADELWTSPELRNSFLSRGRDRRRAVTDGESGLDRKCQLGQEGAKNKGLKEHWLYSNTKTKTDLELVHTNKEASSVRGSSHYKAPK